MDPSVGLITPTEGRGTPAAQEVEGQDRGRVWRGGKAGGPPDPAASWPGPLPPPPGLRPEPGSGLRLTHLTGKWKRFPYNSSL